MGSTPIGLSASRGSSVLGLNQYKSAFELWCELCEEQEPGFCEKNNYPLQVFDGNKATELGNAFETGIIERCEMESIETIIDREKLFFMEREGYKLSCHVDGIYHANEIIHEAKTVNQRYFNTYHWSKPTEEIPAGRFPKYYEVQVQHQQLCAGIDKTILSALIIPFSPDEVELPTNPAILSSWVDILAEMGFMVKFERGANQEARDYMLEAYDKFMNHNVAKRIAPKPVNDDDYKWLHWNFGEVEATKEIINNVAEKKSLAKEVKEAKARIGDLNLEIKRFMADNNEEAFKNPDLNGMAILNNGKKIAGYTKSKSGVWSLR